MINNNRPNISQYAGGVPDGGRRFISDSPIYGHASILALAEDEKVILWSRGSRRDAAKWSLDIADLSELIVSAIQHGRFIGAEWCQERADGPWAACDAWVVTRSEWIENARKYMDTTYYLKFAISRTGDILLMASNHPEST